MANKFFVAPSPHVHGSQSTRSLMRDVLIALLPALAVSTWVYGTDVLTVLFETPLEGEALARCEEELALIFKAKLGCTPEAKGVPMGELPRSEKKTKRIFDSRY